jgi:hypothetical protein
VERGALWSLAVYPARAATHEIAQAKGDKQNDQGRTISGRDRAANIQTCSYSKKPTAGPGLEPGTS